MGNTVADRSALRASMRKLGTLWLMWWVILFTYQAIVTVRYQVQYPDRVLVWTAPNPAEVRSQPTLSHPFLNTQVAWDSEFYLSIALNGYDDPQVRTVPPAPDAAPPFNRPLSLNYAFFPGYPYLIRWVSGAFSWLGFSSIATATVAGVLISLLGTLGGMIALYDLARPIAGEVAGDRAVFYLLSFPTSFFLAQVYTEGLFIGLSFGCLALLQRRYWLVATLFAVLASLTRPVGVLLTVPLLLTWTQSFKQNAPSRLGFVFRILIQGILSLLPLFVYLYWRFSFWGGAFQIVQKQFFQCQTLNLSAALSIWWTAILSLSDYSATMVHNAIELIAVLFGIVSCLITLYRYPSVSIYGLLIMLFSTTCGTAWSISRYLLAVPSVFLVLGDLGRSEQFDRGWSLFSILLLAMLTALFSFNLWAG